jgi:hypothetical protein
MPTSSLSTHHPATRARGPESRGQLAPCSEEGECGEEQGMEEVQHGREPLLALAQTAMISLELGFLEATP